MKHQLTRASALALLSGLAASPTFAQDMTVRALMEDVPETRIIEALLPEFTEQTGIAVEFEKVGYGDMHDKLVAQLVGGESYYNLLSVDFLWAGEFPEAGWLSDLTPFVEASDFDMSGFIPSMLDLLGASEDSLPIIPMYNYSMGLIYRTDLLEARGGTLPDTLEGYVELAKAVSADGEVVGAAMQGQKGDPNAMEFSNYLYAAGGSYLDDAGAVALDSDAAVTALTLYTDAIQNAAQTGALSATLDDTMRLMCSGEAFSMVTYWWMLPQLDNAQTCPEVSGKLALSVMPGGAGESGGWGWGIPSNVSDADKDAAWQFIEWVQSKEVAIKRAIEGHAPVQSDVFSAPEVLEAHPYYADGQAVVEAGKSFPIFTYSAQYEDVLGTQISLAASDDASPADAIAAAASGLADLMDQ
ncbi:extracellular solute-binding protein [Salipiger sp. 1_MG-2023]|uniref:ABC transporter substrate-binding protein n=1 Tax=Salipiger sp. 1_MG-2023 TaxID=3062665 RepID=UPI0026E26F5F|nr:extracellular solute-binding protein [Salipiger sp. 1_MG-2023]MDO6584663.1 extracellular solute-binding protein [Salipiger sp. 1_MG-2023]